MIKKKILYCLLFVQVWLIFNTQSIVPQSIYDNGYREEAMNNRDHIIVFTDRNIYAVNERIYFRSFYKKAGEPLKEILSKVLYVEMVTQSGNAITNGKYYHDENGSSGYLTIPADALTGNYYLRCYTRWMRNFGPLSFFYIPLKIINPFKQDLLIEKNNAPHSSVEMFRMTDREVRLQTDKVIYAPGEVVQVELSAFDSDFSLSGEYCLTVVPAGSADTLYAHIDTESPGMNEDFSFDYLPDIRGVSISGTVVETEDQSPLSSAQVHFSLPGEQAGYFATKTDERGRFIINIPDRTGIRELFVACDFPENIKGEIRIDHDFASNTVPFDTKAFELSSEEKKVATQLAINMQLSMAYEPDKINTASRTETDSLFPFYGLAKTVIKTGKFIQLPNMTEVFENLVPGVLIRYKRGNPYLTIESFNSTISMFSPLIIIDHIPVFDLKAVLSLDPSNIEKIEVIDEIYYSGNLMFGGIIIFTSIEGNMAAIDLPQGSYFFDYQTFHAGNLRDWKGFSADRLNPYPGSGITQKNDSMLTERIPDTRNTLLWIDKIDLGPNEKKTLHFPASSIFGEYHILARGVSSRGDLVCGVSTFRVK